MAAFFGNFYFEILADGNLDGVYAENVRKVLEKELATIEEGGNNTPEGTY